MVVIDHVIFAKVVSESSKREFALKLSRRRHEVKQKIKNRIFRINRKQTRIEVSFDRKQSRILYVSEKQTVFYICLMSLSHGNYILEVQTKLNFSYQRRNQVSTNITISILKTLKSNDLLLAKFYKFLRGHRNPSRMTI